MSEFNYINRVELAGMVGSIRVTEVSGVKVARLSLATENIYRSNDGTVFVDTEWHAVTAWSSSEVEDVTTLKKGDFIKVTGRLSSKAYVSAEGHESRMVEVLANTLVKLR